MNVRSIQTGALSAVLCAALLVSPGAPAWAQQAGEMIAVNPQMVKFSPVPNVPHCATAAPLRGDPATGPSVLLVKMTAGCRIPWHWHTPNEQVMVISGTGVLEMKEGKLLPLRPGAYASLPGHHVHQASCSTPCMLFNISDGIFDIHYVDATGQEIPADKAVKVVKTPAAKRTKRK